MSTNTQALKVQISYIAQCLNIKLDITTAASIAQKLSQFNQNEQLEFIMYIESNITHVNLGYLSAFQKFLKLFSMFCTQKIEAKDVDEDVRALFDKTVAYFCALHQYSVVEQRFDMNDIGVSLAILNYFSKNEIAILSKIGKRQHLTDLAVNNKFQLLSQITQYMQKALKLESMRTKRTFLLESNGQSNQDSSFEVKNQKVKAMANKANAHSF